MQQRILTRHNLAALKRRCGEPSEADGLEQGWDAGQAGSGARAAFGAAFGAGNDVGDAWNSGKL